MNSRNVFLSGLKRGYDLSLGCMVISFGALFQQKTWTQNRIICSLALRAASKTTTMM